MCRQCELVEKHLSVLEAPLLVPGITLKELSLRDLQATEPLHRRLLALMETHRDQHMAEHQRWVEEQQRWERQWKELLAREKLVAEASGSMQSQGPTC